MMGSPWHFVPGGIGAAATLTVFSAVNMPDWPREIEAVLAACVGLGLFAICRWCVTQITREESTAETMLAEAGISAEQSALRAAGMIETARGQLAAMEQAGRDRRPELRAALGDLTQRMERLFDDMLAKPETTRRAEDLLRRSLPRVEAAFLDYCRFAERGDGVVDTQETRSRLIAALVDTGAAVDRARKDLIRAKAEDADISLSVLEGTLARSR